MELLDKEHYVNIIELLKKSLEFYAKEDNYEKRPVTHICVETMTSNVELDQGGQARFTLKSVESILKQTQEMGDNIDELMKNYGVAGEANVNPMEKLLKDIEKLKNSGN